MKKLKLIGVILLIGICFSCKDDGAVADDLTQEQEATSLSEMFVEIESLASSVSCSDSSEWAFVSYGSKACGGPVGYIAYSSTIDTVLFLEKVEVHRIAEEDYNMKWGIASDCSAPSQPNGIRCENDNPVFEY